MSNLRDCCSEDGPVEEFLDIQLRQEIYEHVTLKNTPVKELIIGFAVYLLLGKRLRAKNSSTGCISY